MYRISFYICVVSMFLFFGCSNKYEDQNIEKSLEEIESNTPFSFDSICNKSWDTLYIMKPYSYQEIEKKSLDIPQKYKKEFESLSWFDSFCILIFTENKKMISYAKISMPIANFSYLDTIQYPKEHIFYLNEKRLIMSGSLMPLFDQESARADTVVTEDAINFITDFYKSYTADYARPTDISAQKILVETSLTKRLIEKLDRVGKSTNANAIIQGQDFNENSYNTLNVSHLDGDWFMVSYQWYENGDGAHSIPLKVVNIDGKYFIDYITPMWNGEAYGDHLLCTDMVKPPIDDTNTALSFIESFYNAYTYGYCIMQEDFMSQLRELRTEYLTDNALAQFKLVEDEWNSDHFTNYDLLIDNFDFDCAWHSSLNFSQSDNNTFQVSFRRWDFSCELEVKVIKDTNNRYKIDSIIKSK